MPADRPAPAVPLARQIACVERELRMRRSAYPRWIAGGRMKQADAERETAEMEAVLDTLRRLAGPPPQAEMAL